MTAINIRKTPELFLASLQATCQTARVTVHGDCPNSPSVQALVPLPVGFLGDKILLQISDYETSTYDDETQNEKVYRYSEHYVADLLCTETREKGQGAAVNQ